MTQVMPLIDVGVNSNLFSNASNVGVHPINHVDEAFVRAAVEQAEVNALRIALCHVTGDKELEAMKITKVYEFGGASVDYVLEKDDQERVRRKAVEYLLSRNDQTLSSSLSMQPSKEETYRLLDLFSDVPMNVEGQDGFDYDQAYEELAFEEFPREINWSQGQPPATVKDWKVVIVGAGISGLAAAVALKRLSIPFEVIERQSNVGGTWFQNNYPNVRVDSSAYAYQYKFTKGYRWKDHFPAGAQVQEYLKLVADKYHITEHIRFNHELLKAVWDEQTSKWNLILKSGSSSASYVKLTCNVVISASGLFNKPKVPDIDGIQNFKGPIFHTSRWDHSVNTQGKRIALIGTGSTGTQLAPALAETAQQLTVYQRTPMWIIPFSLFRAPVTDELHWLFENLPYFWNWYCYANWYKSLNFQPLQKLDHKWIANGGHINKQNDSLRQTLIDYIHDCLSDRPDLIPKMMPKSAPLVRRMIVDNGFYQTIKRPNVELVAESIEYITENGIKTSDGIREFDMIALGVGFEVARYLWPADYIGRDGITLEKLWEKDGARSYLGMVFPHYPNLFTLYGPNHQPRTGGFHSWSEAWARYAVAGIVGMIEGGFKSMEVKREIYDDYNTRLDEKTQTLLWESDGNGYFVNQHGRQGVNMPWEIAEYHRMLKMKFEDFHVR